LWEEFFEFHENLRMNIRETVNECRYRCGDWLSDPPTHDCVEGWLDDEFLWWDCYYAYNDVITFMLTNRHIVELKLNGDIVLHQSRAVTALDLCEILAVYDVPCDIIALLCSFTHVC